MSRPAKCMHATVWRLRQKSKMPKFSWTLVVSRPELHPRTLVACTYAYCTSVYARMHAPQSASKIINATKFLMDSVVSLPWPPSALAHNYTTSRICPWPAHLRYDPALCDRGGWQAARKEGTGRWQSNVQLLLLWLIRSMVGSDGQ